MKIRFCEFNHVRPPGTIQVLCTTQQRKCAHLRPVVVPRPRTAMPAMASPAMDPKASVDDEEDDYMSMTIVEPTKPKEKETYTQRRIRKEREVF